MKKQTVWVFVYKHSHGVDISAFSTEKKARSAAAEIIDEEREQWDEGNDKVKTSWSLVDKWWHHTGGREDMEVRQCDVE